MKQTRRILLVEDDDDHAEIVCFYTQEIDPHTEVTRLRDGAAAVDWVAHAGQSTDEDMPWLVLLDLKLPRYDGHEVLARIRAEPALSLLPVVVCSTSATATDVERALGAGANAYITKPAEPGGFERMLRGLLDFWSFSPHDHVQGRARSAAE